MESIAPEAIYKIACNAQNMEDVVRLTELQKSQPRNKTIIVAMGEGGQVLRLLGPSLGAFTSFASADNSPAAPGQMYYREMKEILSLMEGTSHHPYDHEPASQLATSGHSSHSLDVSGSTPRKMPEAPDATTRKADLRNSRNNGGVK